MGTGAVLLRAALMTRALPETQAFQNTLAIKRDGADMHSQLDRPPGSHAGKKASPTGSLVWDSAERTPQNDELRRQDRSVAGGGSGRGVQDGAKRGG